MARAIADDRECGCLAILARTLNVDLAAAVTGKLEHLDRRRAADERPG